MSLSTRKFGLTYFFRLWGGGWVSVGFGRESTEGEFVGRNLKVCKSIVDSQLGVNIRGSTQQSGQY